MNMIKCAYIVHNTGISLLLLTESVGYFKSPDGTLGDWTNGRCGERRFPKVLDWTRDLLIGSQRSYQPCQPRTHSYWGAIFLILFVLLHFSRKVGKVATMQKVSFSDCFMAGCSCMRRLDTCVSCTYMSYFRFFSVKLLSWQPYIFSVSKMTSCYVFPLFKFRILFEVWTELWSARCADSIPVKRFFFKIFII